jgi:hypothetical protein
MSSHKSVPIIPADQIHTPNELRSLEEAAAVDGRASAMEGFASPARTRHLRLQKLQRVLPVGCRHLEGEIRDVQRAVPLLKN